MAAGKALKEELSSLESALEAAENLLQVGGHHTEASYMYMVLNEGGASLGQGSCIQEPIASGSRCFTRCCMYGRPSVCARKLCLLRSLAGFDRAVEQCGLHIWSYLVAKKRAEELRDTVLVYLMN